MAENNPTPPAPNQQVGRQVQVATPETASKTASNVSVHQRGPIAGVVDGSHYKDGKITRSGMERVIQAGGSVLHNGQVINSLGALPSEAELAKGDEAATADAQASIERRRAQLDAEEQTLKANRNK